MSPLTFVMITIVVSVVGSMGAPLMTRVALDHDVSTTAAQWTLTITLLTGCVSTPVLGALATGRRRRFILLLVLALTMVGSLLALVPAFIALLVGRALQGTALGLPSLMMSIARDSRPDDDAIKAVSLISVVATFGIGAGYPLAGWLADVGGLRLAYLMGLLVVGLALVSAVWFCPPSSNTDPLRVDLRGTLLLAPALIGLLLTIGSPVLWHQSAIGAMCLASVLALLLLWMRHELGSASPVVDISVLRRPPVLVANAATFIGGTGIYLTQTIVLRYLQTPSDTGYGFGATTLVASLALFPFALAGWIGKLIVTALVHRVRRDRVLIASAAVATSSCLCFAIMRDHLADSLIATGLLGLGVSGFAVVVPTVVMDHVATGETATSMGVNQVIRTLGYAVGSALAGLVLAPHTRHGHRFPPEDAYTQAAELGSIVLCSTVLLGVVFSRVLADPRRPSRPAGTEHT